MAEAFGGCKITSADFTIMDYHSRWDSLSEEDFSDSKFITNRNWILPSIYSR